MYTFAMGTALTYHCGPAHLEIQIKYYLYLFMHNECIIFLLIYFYLILAYPVLATSTNGLFSVINFLPYYISQSAENISIFVYQLSIFVNLTLVMLTNLNELIHDHFYQECGNFF